MEGDIGRREALRRAAVLLGGVFGLSLAKAPMALAGPADAEKAYPASLVLFGVDWRRDSASGQAGVPQVPGERATVYGTLVAQPGGSAVGEFQAASFFGESPLSASGSASIELHTFQLGEDTIFGMGNAFDAVGVFAVVGGSGRYAGARGSYVAEQSHFESGGDGTARFDFTLL